MKTIFRASLVVLPALSFAVGHAQRAQAAEPEARQRHAAGSVLTITNATGGNELVAFDRDADGALTAAGTFATGGTGTGAGLGSQGALARDGEWLFVVNAGSSDISVFSVAGRHPTLVSRHASGGTGPISLTAHDGLVYVLNATAPANITGFWVDDRGTLHPIDDSTQALSAANVGPAQVSFSPGGESLVVTEKTTSKIDWFALDWHGRAQAAVVSPSVGTTPFGFDFTPRGELVVSEAATGSASAYDFTRDGRARVVSGEVVDGQAAPCWLVVSNDGEYAFTANAASGNISAYRIGAHGALVLDGVSASTGAGSHPIDLAVTARAPYLYSLANVAGTVEGFEVGGGALASVGAATGLPASASGLVAW